MQYSPPIEIYAVEMLSTASPRYAKHDTLRNSIMSQRKKIRGRARNAIYGAMQSCCWRNLFTVLPVPAQNRLSQLATL